MGFARSWVLWLLVCVTLALSVGLVAAIYASRDYFAPRSVAIPETAPPVIALDAHLIAQHAVEMERLEENLAQSRRENESLAMELASARDEIAIQSRAIANALTLAAHPEVNIGDLRRRIASYATLATTLGDRMIRRLSVGATRNVASAPAESVPFWGIAIVASVTSLELYDTCQTMLDITELTNALTETSGQPDDVTEVCGQEVPTRDELWTFVQEAPAQAYAAISEYDLSVPEFEVPARVERAIAYLGSLMEY